MGPGSVYLNIYVYSDLSVYIWVYLEKSNQHSLSSIH